MLKTERTYTLGRNGCGNCAETQIRMSDIEEHDKRIAHVKMLLSREKMERKKPLKIQLKGTKKNYSRWD